MKKYDLDNKRKSKIMMKGKRGYRISVYRSSRKIYAQLIDDIKGKTVISVDEKEIKSGNKMTKTDKAKLLGTLLAEKAKKTKIGKLVFDKGKYRYHGRVKALAQGAREGGLKF